MLRSLSLAVSVVLAMSAMPKIAWSEAGCQSASLPAYYWRSGPEWNRILNDPIARARISVIVIPPCSVVNGQLTPCVKPGDKPIPEYVEIVRRAKAHGIKVLSYVWTDNGRRAASSIKEDINRAKANYNLDGIFLDGVAATAPYFPYYADLANHIRAAPGGFVALNPGVLPSTPSFMQIADLVITFEGTYSTYVSKYAAPDWVLSYPAAKFWHVIHTVPAGAASYANALRLSQLRNAGSVYLTDDTLDNPYNVLPSFWASQLDLMTSWCR